MSEEYVLNYYPGVKVKVHCDVQVIDLHMYIIQIINILKSHHKKGTIKKLTNKPLS